MAASIKYQIEPKQIDSDGNEFDLPAYTIQSTDTVNDKQEFALASNTGSTYTTLNSSTGHVSVELQSDQAVDFDIMDSTGGTLLSLTATKNIIWSNTSGKTYTYKILNQSGSTANVVWRLYV
ncbi:hypothetical protein DRQ25_17605 [Candidatus Fermentibacteria bacterium]|nr:MAG: hypothetical protein DRQ25_17605 [Candidatus Fermentibacteria bacterium]